MKYGIGEVQGDQLVARECYLAMLAIDEQLLKIKIKERMVVKPIEVLDDVLLDESKENYTRIVISMEEKTKQELTQFLKKSEDVFSWSHEYMLEIDPSVITHHLNVSLSYKLVH